MMSNKAQTLAWLAEINSQDDLKWLKKNLGAKGIQIDLTGLSATQVHSSCQVLLQMHNSIEIFNIIESLYNNWSKRKSRSENSESKNFSFSINQEANATLNKLVRDLKKPRNEVLADIIRNANASNAIAKEESDKRIEPYIKKQNDLKTNIKNLKVELENHKISTTLMQKMIQELIHTNNTYRMLLSESNIEPNQQLTNEQSAIVNKDSKNQYSIFLSSMSNAYYLKNPAKLIEAFINTPMFGARFIDTLQTPISPHLESNVAETKDQLINESTELQEEKIKASENLENPQNPLDIDLHEDSQQEALSNSDPVKNDTENNDSTSSIHQDEIKNEESSNSQPTKPALRTPKQVTICVNKKLKKYH